MKIVIAADSFKGNMTSLEVSGVMEQGVRRVFPDAMVNVLPIADGGEGTVDSILYCLKGEKMHTRVKDPLGRGIEAGYGILEGKRAVIEMAASSGIGLLEHEELNPWRATSYGTGQLIVNALDQGCREIFVAIGGSATNDGGVGMAQALGLRFLDRNGENVGPGGEALGKIHSIDRSKEDPRIRETQFFVLCDVSNPLCGEKGATAVYGPQKGADAETVCRLDKGMQHYAEITAATIGRDDSGRPGAGAAGGLGFAMMVFLNAEQKSGIETVMDLIRFDSLVRDADLVITGEGRIDGQTAFGKVPIGVAKRAGKAGVPSVAIGGCITEDAKNVFSQGIGAMESSVFYAMKNEEAIRRSRAYIADAAERMMRAIQTGMKIQEKISKISNKEENNV